MHSDGIAIVFCTRPPKVQPSRAGQAGVNHLVGVSGDRVDVVPRRLKHPLAVHLVVAHVPTNVAPHAAHVGFPFRFWRADPTIERHAVARLGLFVGIVDNVVGVMARLFDNLLSLLVSRKER